MNHGYFIRLVYNKNYIGNLTIKRSELDILEMEDYIKLLIRNYNANLVNVINKTSYDFAINFFRAANGYGKDVQILANLKEKSLKTYNLLNPTNKFENHDDVENYIGLVPQDILFQEDTDPTIKIEIDLDKNVLRICGFTQYDVKKYLSISHLSSHDIKTIDYDVENLAFNDIEDCLHELFKVSMRATKLFKTTAYPSIIYEI